MMIHGKQRYIECDHSGLRIVCNGQGRHWVAEYKGWKGVILGMDRYSSGMCIRFDNGEETQLYSNEFESDPC